MSMQAGQTVSLVCTTDGVPTPTVNWFKDGCLLEVALNRRYQIAEEMVPGFQAHILQALRSTLVLPELDEKDSGNYSCVASNEIDTAILNQTYELTVSRGKVLPEHKVQVSNLTDLSILYSLPKLLR